MLVTDELANQPSYQTGAFEVMNTILPAAEQTMKKAFSALSKIPKMSTLAIGAIIQQAVQQMPINQAFVDVGVWHGFTLLAGMLNNPDKTCIGIDNFSMQKWGSPRKDFLKRFKQYQSPAHHFYEMDYQDYFATVHQEPIGFYIYDGNHEYKHQLQGLQIAEPFFGEGCLILVDDTNWQEPKEATLDFIKSSEKKYQMLFDRTTVADGHPTFWNGIMIFRCV